MPPPTCRLRALTRPTQYQYTFFQKTDWSAYYAPGREILGYLQNVVDTYKLAPYLHLGHEMTAARYDESTGKWHVRVRRAFSSGENGAEVHHEEFEDTADLLFTAVGMLSRWKWPDIDGLGRFNGTIMHSANWDLGRTGESAVSDETSQLKPDWKDDVRDWGTKRAAVIGAVGLNFLNCAHDIRHDAFLGIFSNSDHPRSPASCGNPLQLRTQQDVDSSASPLRQDGAASCS